jgi:hypothetical protein
MRNGIFHVAKEEGSEEVLGVACWLKPQPTGQPASWYDWLEGWRLWMNQVGMNLYFGRGGLIVKVSGCNFDESNIRPRVPPVIITTGRAWQSSEFRELYIVRLMARVNAMISTPKLYFRLLLTLANSSD